MRTPDPAGWALIALSGVLVLGGLAVLYQGRSWFGRRGLKLADDAESKRRPILSPPTRYSVGVLLFIAGYHAGVWAFPATFTPLQLPREWWWAWVLTGAALIGLSLGLDRLERKSLGEDDTQ